MNKIQYHDKYYETLRILLNKLTDEKGERNTVFSPFSLMMLLAIAADATEGKTKEEITQVLCGKMDYDEFKEVIFAVQNELTKDESLHLANAVLVQEALQSTVTSGYADKLARQFDGELFAAQDMISAVNTWVNDKTNGMISNVANDSMKNMLFALVNAVSFEAEWEEEYEETDVINDDFTNADRSVSRVKMLKSGESTYLENQVFEGFVKPYKNSGFSYVALLPKKGEGAISEEDIQGIDPDSFRVNPDAIVSVTMPEFTCSFDEEMTPLFQELGIKTVFTEKADFAPLSSAWLKAQSIIHKAYIEVDRKGTKAVAVSFLPGEAGCLPTNEFRDIKIDRPFVYAIVHNDTGLPIFVGTINHLETLTGDDLMTEEEMGKLFDDMCTRLQGEEFLGCFELGRDTPEYHFYERGRYALARNDGKELRKIAEEAEAFMNK